LAGVQIQIQLENTNARLTKRTKLPAPRMLLNQRANLGFAHPVFACDARNLELRGCRRNVRDRALIRKK